MYHILDSTYDITYMWSLKYDTIQHIYETKTDSEIEQTVVAAGGVGVGVGRGGKGWELHIHRGKLLCTGWINDRVLPYGAGNCIQCPVTNHNRKENMYIYIKNIYLCTCITESLCCTEEINTT